MTSSKRRNDNLVNVASLLDLVHDWKSFLKRSPADEINLLHHHEPTGRSLGTNRFVENLEQVLKRSLQPEKPGPKKKGGGEFYILSPELQD